MEDEAKNFKVELKPQLSPLEEISPLKPIKDKKKIMKNVSFDNLEESIIE